MSAGLAFLHISNGDLSDMLLVLEQADGKTWAGRGWEAARGSWGDKLKVDNGRGRSYSEPLQDVV